MTTTEVTDTARGYRRKAAEFKAMRRQMDGQYATLRKTAAGPTSDRQWAAWKAAQARFLAAMPAQLDSMHASVERTASQLTGRHREAEARRLMSAYNEYRSQVRSAARASKAYKDGVSVVRCRLRREAKRRGVSGSQIGSSSSSSSSGGST